MEIKYLQEVNKDKQHSLWYGGNVVEITYDKNIKFIIAALGDVIGFISNRAGESIVKIKDKSNNSVFPEIVESYTNITNDDELMFSLACGDLENYNNVDYSIKLDYSNWWELRVMVNGKYYELGINLDSDYLDDAINEIKNISSEIVKYIEEDNR